VGRSKWKCKDCLLDTGKAREHYFLKDEVWNEAGMGKIGMLCIEHVESRLGRRLNRHDFTSAWINNPKTQQMSARLLDRIMSDA